MLRDVRFVRKRFLSSISVTTERTRSRRPCFRKLRTQEIYDSDKIDATRSAVRSF
ncbi:unnamed protein product, partial [Amoebophrya sp. A120]|eukprot:GSA120T00012445001.1